MDEHPGIGFVDGPTGRRAVLLGAGLDVWEVVAIVTENRQSVAAAAAYLEVPVATVRVAVRYYATYSGEIDEILERQAAVAEREESAAKRERAILT